MGKLVKLLGAILVLSFAVAFVVAEDDNVEAGTGQSVEGTGQEIGHEAGQETGHEAGQETGQEAGHEAGQETGQETGHEAGQETGQEAGHEAGQETGHEAGQETGHEAGQEDESDEEDENDDNEVGEGPVQDLPCWFLGCQHPSQHVICPASTHLAEKLDCPLPDGLTGFNVKCCRVSW